MLQSLSSALGHLHRSCGVRFPWSWIVLPSAVVRDLCLTVLYISYLFYMAVETCSRVLSFSLFVSIAMNIIQPFGFPSPSDAGDDGSNPQDSFSLCDVDQQLQQFASVGEQYGVDYA